MVYQYANFGRRRDADGVIWCIVQCLTQVLRQTGLTKNLSVSISTKIQYIGVLGEKSFLRIIYNMV